METLHAGAGIQYIANKVSKQTRAQRYQLRAGDFLGYAKSVVGSGGLLLI